jgi:hypothetical protein
MFNTDHFSDAADFQRQSDDFARWLSQQTGVTLSPKIQIQDLRHQGSGRGVGKLLLFAVSILIVSKFQFLIRSFFQSPTAISQRAKIYSLFLAALY